VGSEGEFKSVFISYSHVDKDFARQLAADLAKAGCRVWRDEGEIDIGERLMPKIRAALDEMESVVVVLSKTSVNSEWVKVELDIAMNKELKKRSVVVLPAVIEDIELPSFLEGKLYADFKDPQTYEATLSKLLRALKVQRSNLPETTKDFNAEGTIRQDDRDSLLKIEYNLNDPNRIHLIRNSVNEEIRKVRSELTDDNFPLKAAYNKQELARRMAAYEEITSTLVKMLIAGCHDGKLPDYNRIWVKTLQDVAEHCAKGHFNSDEKIWNDFRLYPALLLLYAGGIASIIAGKWGTLAELFVGGNLRSEEGTVPIVYAVHAWNVINIDYSEFVMKEIEAEEYHTRRLNIKVFQFLSSKYDNYISSHEFESFFDMFEYILGLVHADLYQKKSGQIWAPTGLFVRRRHEYSQSPLFRFEENEYESAREELLRRKLWSGSIQRFQDIKLKYDDFVKKIRKDNYILLPNWEWSD